MTRIKDQVRKTEFKYIDYDAGCGVKFNLGYMPKAEFQRLIQKHTKMTFNQKTHQPDEVINHEALSKEIFHTYISGWQGVTHEWLASKMPYDVPEGVNPKDAVEFSADNLDDVISSLYGIDAWAMEAIKNFDNFAEKKAAQGKN